MYDVIVIGAGVAGMTAAIYGARAGKKILLIEGNNFGGQITASPCVENYPGFLKISGMELADNLFEQVSMLPITVAYEQVMKLHVKSNVIVETEADSYEGKTVVLATGSQHRKLGLKREEELVGQGISYCALCDGPLYKNKKVAVVGGGNTAIQNAIFLSEYCQRVDVFVRKDKLRAKLDDVIESKNNIHIHFETKVTELIGQDELEKVIVDEKGQAKEYEIAALFISVGQVPHNDFLKELVLLDEEGYIVASEDCKTNLPMIFAAGDCRTKQVRQLTTASADGTVAAIQACSYIDNIN